jgi:hypothetical protein
MVMYSYRAVMQENGQIQIKGDAEIPAGTELIVTVVGEHDRDEDDEKVEEEGISAEELLSAPFIGIWADRDDIGDSAEFAERIRRNWEHRSHAEED